MFDYSSHTQMLKTGEEGNDKIPRYVARGSRVNGFICLMDILTMERKIVKQFKTLKGMADWLAGNQEHYSKGELAILLGESDGPQ